MAKDGPEMIARCDTDCPFEMMNRLAGALPFEWHAPLTMIVVGGLFVYRFLRLPLKVTRSWGPSLTSERLVTSATTPEVLSRRTARIRKQR